MIDFEMFKWGINIENTLKLTNFNMDGKGKIPHSL